MQMIKSESVVLRERTVTGKDDFGQETATFTDVTVNNVIVGSPSSEDVLSEIELTGKHIAYTLGIPKSDSHSWVNTTVVIRNKTYRTIGIPTEIPEGSMPTWWAWGKQVKVEHYE